MLEYCVLVSGNLRERLYLTCLSSVNSPHRRMHVYACTPVYTTLAAI